MERRSSARRRARGGEGIPAQRADRARLAAAVAAVAAAAATGAWLAVVAEDGYLARATIVATVVGCGLLAGGLVLRRPVAIPLAAGVVAAPYVAVLAFEADSLDARAPIVAALLLVTAELAYWSLELRGALADEAGTYLRRLSILAALAVGTIVSGTAILALVAGITTRGTAIDVLGAAAALAAVALLVLAAASRRALG